MINLIKGDCLEKMKDIPDKSIDMILTSPPYDNLRTYNGNISQWNEDKWKNIIKDLFRILKDGGVCVWIVGDATIKGSESGTSFKQALYFKEIGFNLHDTMIWEKPTFTATGSLAWRYAPVFEYMFVFTKGKIKTFNPIKDKVNKNGGTTHKASTIRTQNGFRKMSGDKHIKEFGQRHNVWHQAGECSNKNRLHPAPFPEKLAKDHIISWSNENDTILDCFMGSGTTGKMAKELNRNFIGIELDEEYFNIAKNRIENHKIQGNLTNNK